MSRGDVAVIEEALRTGKFASLLGRREDDFFEAKGAAAYDLDLASGRYELAKDVSSFANAAGGIVLIGLQTRPVDAERTDEVEALDLIPEAAYPLAKVLGVIRTHIYPLIVGIDVEWIPSEKTHYGLCAIRIPPQSEVAMPFVITAVTEEGVELKRFLAGYAVRIGGSSQPMEPKRLQRALKEGMNSHSQRLTRIEEMVRLLVEKSLESRNPAAKPGSNLSLLKERASLLLGEI